MSIRIFSKAGIYLVIKYFNNKKYLKIGRTTNMKRRMYEHEKSGYLKVIDVCYLKHEIEKYKLWEHIGILFLKVCGYRHVKNREFFYYDKLVEKFKGIFWREIRQALGVKIILKNRRRKNGKEKDLVI